jgi:hypothetical protein
MWPFGSKKKAVSPIPAVANAEEADARVMGMPACSICGQSFAAYSLDARVAHLSAHQQAQGLHGPAGAKRLGL